MSDACRPRAEPSQACTHGGRVTTRTMRPSHAGASPWRGRPQACRRSNSLRRCSDLLGRSVQPGHVTSWENSATPPGDVLMAITALAPTNSSTLGVRSHKFIAAHVGHDACRQLVDEPGTRTGHRHLGRTSCWIGPVPDTGDHCSMSLFPFGTVIIHLLEDLDLPTSPPSRTGAYQSYPENLAWAGQYLTDAIGADITAAYVLSAYWVYAAPWAGRNSRHRAAPHLRTPSTRRPRRHQHRPSRQRARRARTARRWLPPDPRCADSAAQALSSAWASWSGVVYHPHDPLRCLAENDLVQFQIGVQAIWAFTAYINGQIEVRC